MDMKSQERKPLLPRVESGWGPLEIGAVCAAVGFVAFVVFIVYAQYTANVEAGHRVRNNRAQRSIDQAREVIETRLDALDAILPENAPVPLSTFLPGEGDDRLWLLRANKTIIVFCGEKSSATSVIDALNAPGKSDPRLVLYDPTNGAMTAGAVLRVTRIDPEKGKVIDVGD